MRRSSHPIVFSIAFSASLLAANGFACQVAASGSGVASQASSTVTDSVEVDASGTGDDASGEVDSDDKALLTVTETSGVDPGFCIVQPEEPASVEIFADFQGRRFYFCCELCRRDFLSDPSRFDSLVDEVNDAEEFQFNDRPNAYANTFWGRVGRVMLWMQRIGGSFERVFHLKDHASFALFITFLLCIGGIGYRWRKTQGNDRPRRPSAVVAALVVVAFVPCFYADSLRHSLRHATHELHETAEEMLRIERDYRDLYDEDQIHYATFLNFGDPPIPRPNPLPPALQRTYFRGNDERSELMSHGGNYRTVTFDLWMEDEGGQRLKAGDKFGEEAGNAKDWILCVRFERGSETASGYFTDQYMQRMYVTMQSGRYLGRDEPVPDRVSWKMIEHEQVWVAKYKLPKGVYVRTESTLPGQIARERKIDSNRPDDLSGVVYLCEDRYDHKRMIGGRFHYAVGYDIRNSDGVISPMSDLWMEATYRGRNFADLQISDEEWLSATPIPEK